MRQPSYQVLELSDTESDFNGTPNLTALQDISQAFPEDNITSPGASSLILDLTADEHDFVHNTNDDDYNNKDINKPGASVHNSIALDDDTYAFFVEAGLDNPEELSMLGINLDEIKAQKQIAKRLETENKRDYEYAIQLQKELREQGGPSSNSTVNTSSSSNNTSAHISDAAVKLEPSATSQVSPKRELEEDEQQVEHSSKKIKLGQDGKDITPIEIDNDDDCIDLTDENATSRYNPFNLDDYELAVMMQRELDGSSSSSQPFSSTTSFHRGLGKQKAPVQIIDDDEDLIDLTDENAILYRDPYTLIDSDDESSNSDLIYEDYLSNPLYDQALRSLMAGVSRPFADMSVPRIQGTSPSSGRSTQQPAHTRIPEFQSHMAALAAQHNGRRAFPGRYHAPLNQQETERELRELLENIVSDEPPPPEDRTGTPDGLSINLLEHQKIGLQWMLKMENSNNKGGILADDMGLGKTIQALATIVEKPCQDATPIDHRKVEPNSSSGNLGTGELKIKATLIVCPVSLMDQWRREIEEKTQPKLKVLVFHGNARPTNPRHLALYDVIISSYSVTAYNYRENQLGPFSKIVFHRVILDEAHTIKNKMTVAARGCCQIDATFRWCMTATPIQNKIDELYSLIKFLRIRPFCDWNEFRDTIITPMKNGNHKKAVRVAAVLMKAIALRRSKKALIDGRPILDLPERNIHMTHIDFSPDERVHYDYVNQRVQARFSKYLHQGVVMKKYSSVLVLLLRLRQCCLHPHLTLTEGSSDEVEPLNEENQIESAKDMPPNVISRLLSDNATLNDIECPICMDTAENAQILKGCGHILCKECLDSYINTNDGSLKRCPQCRGELNTRKLVGIEAFIKAHAPHLLQEAEQEEEAAAAQSEEQAALARVQEYVSSAKIDKMIEILDTTAAETGGKDKTIVFSQFTGFLDLIHQPLKDKGYKFLRYDGSMDIRHRAETVSKFFDDPEVKVLLVSTKCGSLGLNLTCANRVILMDVWWNPALENQAIDRVHRIGQQKPVDVHRIFIKDTVEDRILALQEKKQVIADGVLGEGSTNRVNRLGLQELIYLFQGGELPENENGPSTSRT